MNKMTRKILSTTSLLTAGFLAQVAGAADTINAGKLTIGSDITYPPFESYDGDKVVGFDPEVAALIGEQLKLEPAFIDARFASLVVGLKSNKFDMLMSGMYITPSRTEAMNAVPYGRVGASILVKKGSKIQPATEKDLCGVKVGLLPGESYATKLNEMSETYCKEMGKPAVKIHEFPSAPEVAQAILSGNVDAQVIINGAAKLTVEKTKGRLNISSTDLIYPSVIGIFVNKENKVLTTNIEKSVATIMENGSLPALLEKYDLSPAY